MNLELRHLRYFVAAAELEHFGRAAERLSIVQPALSRQVRELEESVGTPLFERLPRGVRLTAAGRAYLDDARRILGDVDRAAARAREIATGQEGTLRVGFVETTVYHPRLPGVIAKFRRAHPRVRLELVQQPSAALGELVRNEALDLAFVFHPPENVPALVKRPIVREAVRLALPRTHRLAVKRRIVLGDLCDEDFVWIPRSVSPVFHDRVVAACQKAGFTPRVVQEGSSDTAILSLVAVGAGLSFCVESSAHRCPREVVLKPIVDLDVDFLLQAIWRSDWRTPSLASLVALLPAARGA